MPTPNHVFRPTPCYAFRFESHSLVMSTIKVPFSNSVILVVTFDFLKYVAHFILLRFECGPLLLLNQTYLCTKPNFSSAFYYCYAVTSHALCYLVVLLVYQLFPSTPNSLSTIIQLPIQLYPTSCVASSLCPGCYSVRILHPALTLFSYKS